MTTPNLHFDFNGEHRHIKSLPGNLYWKIESWSNECSLSMSQFIQALPEEVKTQAFYLNLIGANYQTYEYLDVETDQNLFSAPAFVREAICVNPYIITELSDSIIEGALSKQDGAMLEAHIKYDATILFNVPPSLMTYDMLDAYLNTNKSNFGFTRQVEAVVQTLTRCQSDPLCLCTLKVVNEKFSEFRSDRVEEITELKDVVKKFIPFYVEQIKAKYGSLRQTKPAVQDQLQTLVEHLDGLNIPVNSLVELMADSVSKKKNSRFENSLGL